MTKPGTRTILALAVAAVLVVVVAVAAVVAVAVHRADEHDPEITAYAHGTAATVPPYRYCTVTQSDASGQLGLKCRETATTVTLETPNGAPLQLSFPRHIADAPWVMVLEYDLPDGTSVQRLASYRDYAKGTLAVTVPSRPEPDLRLAGVEIQLVVPTRDETGTESFAPYQAWSIRTT
ncbi:DUF2771 domain-containing protein [Nocardia blacklockiae]|uniref:DUF2771 domain-containing protein n=1 Tax=Nocardia blacklockiae TaxID=480036 RepID=UPI0018960879|nr:DUF2771 domain-containing protein [Nocardia blacklockiae]MBF6171655.1 DUF2771 domain-containing protein [Nocardia blacklockiae]